MHRREQRIPRHPARWGGRTAHRPEGEPGLLDVIGQVSQPLVTGSGRSDLSATLRVTEDPTADVEVILRVTNSTAVTVNVPNPDVGNPPPPPEWPWSQAAYRASLLISFGLLDMKVSDPSGRPAPSDIPQAWSTPVLKPPLQLAPGEGVELVLPIGLFFDLDPGHVYDVVVRYGNGPHKAEAVTSLSVPA
jgi:hypothetical protein